MSQDPTADNPYRAPEAREEEPRVEPRRPVASKQPAELTDVRIWRDGPYLIVRRGATLPERCVVCGSHEAELRSYAVRMKMSDVVKLMLLLFLGPFFLLFAALGSQASRLRVGFCPTHHAKERLFRRIANVLWLLSIGLMIVGLFALWKGRDIGFLGFIIGFILIWLIMLFVAVRPRPIYAIKMDKHYVWLMKVSPELINEFPQAPTGE